MHFVTATDSDGTTHFINLDVVARMRRSTKGDRTYIQFDQEHSLAVLDRPEDLLAQKPVTAPRESPPKQDSASVMTRQREKV